MVTKIEMVIPDEVIIEVLKDAIDCCMSTSIPNTLPVPEYQRIDMENAFRYCQAMNTVIEYFGGEPVDLSTVPEHNQEPTLADLRAEAQAKHMKEYADRMTAWDADVLNQAVELERPTEEEMKDLNDAVDRYLDENETPASWSRTFYPSTYKPNESVKGQAVPNMPGTFYRND